MFCKDDPTWNVLRKDLRKILYNVNLGTNDIADVSVANGLLDLFFHAEDEDIKQEACYYVERYPQFRNAFASELNSIKH